jgi:hypothetical protein
MSSNMKAWESWEKYPLWIVAMSNFLSFTIYISGFYIFLKINSILSLLYLLFVTTLEFRIIKNHCVNCYYWGKICGFGKGKISAFFFKKGHPEKFCSVPVTWKSMIPDLLVSLLPFVTGIILLIAEFRIDILAALAIIVLFTTSGNSIVRGKLTCKYCKQREAGCAAYALFNK